MIEGIRRLLIFVAIAIPPILTHLYYAPIQHLFQTNYETIFIFLGGMAVASFLIHVVFDFILNGFESG